MARVIRQPPAQPFISFRFALALVTFTLWSTDVMSPALPAIQDDFLLSAKAVGLTVSFFFLGRLLGNFPAARFLDTAGSPRVASIGGLVMVLGSVTNAVAPNIEVLYAGRALQGVGIALLVNAGLRSILSARPGRGVAMTLYGIASTIGSVIGLQSSGLLTGSYGWRSIFVLSAMLGVVLTILPIVSTSVARRSLRPVEHTSTVAGVIVPLRTYLAPLAINFLVFCNYSIWVIVPLYAQRQFDASPTATANLLLIITITHLAAAVPVSRAIGRFGPSRVLVSSLLIAAAGSAGILLANSVWLLGLPLALYGAGMVGAVNSGGDIVLHRGGAGSRAVGSLRQTSDLGLVIGPIVAGAIADALSYSAPFVVFPFLMLVVVAGIVVPGGLGPRTVTENA
ncbi:MAG: MFS transporter [Thermomicrobiales bacterium]|nr:MFS transporter [Thermomicrobiales bacterium]